MEFNSMCELDLKLSLLSGGNIQVENITIEPYKIGEIVNKYGQSRYMKNLQWVSLSVEDFIDSISDKEKKTFLEEQKNTLKSFDFYAKLGGEEMLESLIEALSMIFRTDDVRMLSEGVIAIDFVKLGILTIEDNGDFSVNEKMLDSLREDEIKVIHRDNFDDIINVIKLQNYLEKPSSKVGKAAEDNPADEATRKLMEHMQKMREKVDAKKKVQQGNDGESIDISDIISAVSSKSNSINKLNIWELTLYQLYDEYARLELIDNYDFSVRAMMAGAEKIDLKHWSSKL